ncbi:glutaredoxin family protein [Solimicrobium silvestre]|nr:glutaredoxin family protein [Solimicrobium silvestre]
MTSKLLLSLLLLTLSLTAQAQLYKWVGPDGKVNYSDTPPPKSVTKVETKSFSDSDSGVALPFELAQAAKNMPVTLYSADKCIPCDDSRSYLKQSGIPFSEKTVSSNEDLAKLKQLSGDFQLPLLTIGRSKLKGFNIAVWHTNLTQAGYPDSNKLPPEYQFPTPQPLTSVAVTPKQTDTSVKPGQPEPPARDPNGFQF